MLLPKIDKNSYITGFYLLLTEKLIELGISFYSKNIYFSSSIINLNLIWSIVTQLAFYIVLVSLIRQIYNFIKRKRNIKVVKNQIGELSILEKLQQSYHERIVKSLTPHDFFAILRCNYNESDNSLHFHIHNYDKMNFLLCYDVDTIDVDRIRNAEFKQYHTLNAVLPMQKVELYFKISFFAPDDSNNIVELSENDYDLYIKS